LHSVAVQERRGMLRVWNLSLVLATFCLTILGTFLTRSGVVNSVHSFTTSAIGPLLLGFLAVVVVAGVGLVGWRAERLRSPGSIDSPLSREASFLANNLLFSAFAFVVLLGTVFPLLVEALNGRRLSVGEPYFDRMTAPIGLALIFLMAAAPMLPWRAASTEVLHRRLIVPAWVGAATMALTVALGARGLAQVATFGLGAFALTGIARQWVLGVASRRRSTGEGWVRATVSTLSGNRRLYGGLVVHAGVVTVAIALAASSGYASRAEVRLAEGETARVGGHSVTYLGSDRQERADRTTVSVSLEVRRGVRLLGVNEPALSFFPNMSQAIGTPSVRTGLLRDVYLTLVASPDSSGTVTVGVLVNPLVVWLWIGGLIMAFGTALAAWPGRRGGRGGGRPPAGRPPLREPVLEHLGT
ncbi:MAG: cytochrome c-type biogenesis CcmF C-terminal domain-containing protein, partial [Acidimicrobiia bacterium]